MTPGQRCDECVYGKKTEVGYSCYTWLGTDFECKKKLHPNKAPFDMMEEEKLKYAEKCPVYFRGKPEHDESLFDI